MQVRITLLVLSVSGWTVFAMGMVDVISNLIPRYPDSVLYTDNYIAIYRPLRK